MIWVFIALHCTGQYCASAAMQCVDQEQCISFQDTWNAAHQKSEGYYSFCEVEGHG